LSDPRRIPRYTLFPYTTLFRSSQGFGELRQLHGVLQRLRRRKSGAHRGEVEDGARDLQAPVPPGLRRIPIGVSQDGFTIIVPRESPGLALELRVLLNSHRSRRGRKIQTASATRARAPITFTALL